MSLVKLEGELLKVKENISKVVEVNKEFEKILGEMKILKSRAMASSSAKETIAKELKDNEIIDLFSSVEQDFEKIRKQMMQQSVEKEMISDFIESLRTKKTFSFEDTGKAILFLESAIDALDSSHISARPEYIGSMDLGEVAIELGLHKQGSGIIIEKERFSEALASMFNKSMLRNVVFETDNSKLTLKTGREVVVETSNVNIRKLSRIAK